MHENRAAILRQLKNDPKLLADAEAFANIRNGVEAGGDKPITQTDKRSMLNKAVKGIQDYASRAASVGVNVLVFLQGDDINMGYGLNVSIC
jgi:hypothetical protein